MKIVFLGTPEFAVESLKILVENKFNILAVITSPDKKAGRGLNIKHSEVKTYSLQQKLKILQPTNLKDPDFIKELENLKADVFIVVAFRMLPEIVWNMPSLGTINVHASLLPKYRGAAPIHWAIINGEKETGVTTFKLKHEIDTGNILLQKKIIINTNETTGQLYNRLKIEGANLLLETIINLKDNNLKETPQNKNIDLNTLPLAPKINIKNSLINWNDNCINIKNLINGMNPYPVAHTFIKNKMLKIFEIEYEINQQHNLEIGNILTDKTNYLKFVCKDGFINIKNLLLEGKKRMDIKEFLKGNANLFD